jgi:hypothetical protein
VAQTANLVPVTASSPGTGLVTLTGYSGVAVTLNGAAVGAAFNVFSCTAAITSPAAPTCQLDGVVYVNNGGQASGSLASAVPAPSTAEVFVQNAGNPNELYAAVFVGGYVPGTSCFAGGTYVYVNSLSNCVGVGSTNSGFACNYLNVYTNLPVCVPIGGTYLPFFGLGLFNFNATCVPGLGLQPVLVNGALVYQFC